jgi:hypothetical protein
MIAPLKLPTTQLRLGTNKYELGFRCQTNRRELKADLNTFSTVVLSLEKNQQTNHFLNAKPINTYNKIIH